MPPYVAPKCSTNAERKVSLVREDDFLAKIRISSAQLANSWRFLETSGFNFYVGNTLDVW